MSLEIDPKQIKSFSPINSLNPENAQELIKKISATAVPAGHYVFKKGDTDKVHVYVLSGEIELLQGVQFSCCHFFCDRGRCFAKVIVYYGSL